MGGYLRSHLELPPSCRLGERISVRLSCVNRGSGTLKRVFEVAGVHGEGSFDFLTQDGARMVGPDIKNIETATRYTGGIRSHDPQLNKTTQ
jgi:hypothetical protein